MGPSKFLSIALLSCLGAFSCMQHHEARVQTAVVPPPSATPVQHSGRLWVELGSVTWENQCRTPPGQRMLCFDGVRRSVFVALERSLWSSFPNVALRDGETLRPGDYLLQLDVTINAQPPDADGPGWSAMATGGFRLVRDGKVLREERLGSRSRADFAYGRALGVGAGEVVDAFAAHVAEVLSAVPEDRPLSPTPLPSVVAEVLTPAALPAASVSVPAPAGEPSSPAPAPAADTAPVTAPAPDAPPEPTVSSAPPIAAR